MYDDGLGGWMATRRAKTPAKIALIFGEGSSMTYGQLADGADRVAGLLWSSGIHPGDRVAFMGENSPEFVQVLFGAMQVGAVFVPINTRLAPPEVAHVISDSGARLLIHEPDFFARVEPAIAASAELTAIVTGDGQDGRPGLNELLVDARPAPAVTGRSLSDPAAIIYTSGTTGRAKGAVLSHQNLTWVALNTLVDYDIVSTDVALMISPLFHVASLGMGLLPAVLKGATLVLERGFDAGRALGLIQRYGVTMLSGVPTTYQLMADHPDWATTDVSTLAKLTCGGSAVPTRILNAYEERGLSFSQGYGMTETSPGATSLAPTMTRAKQGSVGLAHFFTSVRVTDETGTPAPVGTVGEIEITGPNVFSGYHGLPDATAAAFSPDGWYRSGDLGYLDSDGYLFISDRLKDMIISGGENIYPAEVENLINDIEGVTGVAVIGVPDDQWGEVPWAVLTVVGDSVPTTESVRAHLDGKLARYKLPRNVLVVDELPRTATGKIRKADLRSALAPRK
ncbi:acyl-CoA synthetase [Naasia lichenicola]|uniref:Long-chain fatty acid--CoA ligase n=1 Tax=Naasia lichenicola TaxID=2565933 RepID=A0A4S4FSH0_9MICO|nr:long-chain fatty acid--CoA ligase [Naasia lichenicola]THG33248.1 long-chain fatty acid--CoA ligase [Naasia lichenicola]